MLGLDQDGEDVLGGTWPKSILSFRETNFFFGGGGGHLENISYYVHCQAQVQYLIEVWSPLITYQSSPY